MRKFRCNTLLVLSAFLITLATTMVQSNACSYMAHETEIPEALKY